MPADDGALGGETVSAGSVVVGCTGGIGAGKSTVLAVLASRGADVLDADAVAREVLVPGGPALDAVVARFGSDVVASDGALDRRRLAELVFADRGARADLDAIVHPAVHRRITTWVAERRRAGAVAVLELPLLVETGGRERYGLDAVLVVDAPDELRLERLTSSRGLAPDDARARLRAQESRGERVRSADYVIVNVGTKAELEAMARSAWRWIESLPRR
jgi:dephospho-CoA kinase